MKHVVLLMIAALFVLATRAQVNLQLLGQLPFPGKTLAGAWHYADGSGNEYALLGASDGIAIVNITNPATPVLLQTVPAANSLWRELRTYGNYCYSGTEGGGGVTIIDLSNLPGPVTHTIWTGNGAVAGQIDRVHTVGVYEDHLYLFGTNNVANGGVVIANLTNPANPQYVGQYNLHYVHDGYVRNNILWAAEIYQQRFSVIDVTDKTNPLLITNQQTPGSFCHNTWLSDDGSHLFTTDEVTNAPLGSFNVTDINNIQLVDIYRTDLMPTGEVHNVRVLNDFLINPSYGDQGMSQITIVDAFYPDNLIEIASYPTPGFLCWDADPYTASGNIIATATNGGLYIFGPYYVRAAYLEGTVRDSVTGVVLNNATVTITANPNSAQTNLAGNYKTGVANGGSYNISFSHTGYFTKSINLTLVNGQVTILDVDLVPLIIGINETTDAINVNVFPNPMINKAIIDVKDTRTANLKITSVSGKEIFNSEVVFPFTFERKNANSGIYFYEIITEDYSFSRGKLIMR
jgi:choice-of-anchor B domain-containing protein